MFEKDYKTLNEAQKEAVESLNKSLLVLAPAGTGKTKVIAMRTAYLINHQVAPEQILSLTFTNKAAKEMRERIGLYMPKEAKRMTIKTFHAFCYHLISHEKASSHFSFPCTLIDEVDSESIIKKIVSQNGLNDDSVYYPNVLSFFENIKRHSLSLPIEQRYDYKKVIQDYNSKQEASIFRSSQGTDQFIAKYGLKLLNTYTRYLKENNCIDFMDLIVEAKYLLEQKDILSKWQKTYCYIQVDEMQDTSCREYEIIKLLAQGNYLAMFGDFNQTIYEWRGSNPMSMTKTFKEDFQPQEITLGINYRSTRILLEAANDYISSSRLYPVQCRPTSPIEGDPITLLESTTREMELKHLVQSIKESEHQKESIAVLTRTNAYAKAIADALKKEEIPCTVIEDTKLFRKKEIKDLLAFFEYTINERNGHALLQIIQHPYIQLEPWLLKAIRGTKSCYMGIQDWFKAESKDPYTALQEAYERNSIIVLDVESTGLSTTKDEIIQIAAIRYGKEGATRELDVLVKPTQSVGDSYYVHGFSDEYLQRDGIEPKEALRILADFVVDGVLVGHNVNYDLQIINSMMSRYGLDLLEGFEVYDTLDLAYKVYPKLHNHKLDTLSKLIDTKANPNHNAMQDILATSEVLSHLLEVILKQKQERLEALEAYYCYIDEYKEKLVTLKNYLKQHTIQEGITYMMNSCGFKEYYTAHEIRSIRELYRIAGLLHEEECSNQDNKIQLLAFCALHYSEIEQSELFKDRIPIITVHQAKGLEFDTVYIAGCNDRTFPSYRSVKENKLTEEMRLFYVAMTRAKRKLYLSYHQEAKRSIFIDEIGEKYKVCKKYSQTMSDNI